MAPVKFLRDLTGESYEQSGAPAPSQRARRGNQWAPLCTAGVTRSLSRSSLRWVALRLCRTSFGTVHQRADYLPTENRCSLDRGRGHEPGKVVAVNDCGGRAAVHTGQRPTVALSLTLVARP
jgi:hypothetical protein